MHVLLRLRGTDTSETISTINLKGGILRFPVSFSILQVPENFLLKSFPCKCIHSHKTETQTGFVEPIGCCFILSFPSVSSSGKQLHHRKLFMPLEGSDLSALPQCDQSLQQKFSITQGYYSENFRSDCAGMQAAYVSEQVSSSRYQEIIFLQQQLARHCHITIDLTDISSML